MGTIVVGVDCSGDGGRDGEDLAASNPALVRALAEARAHRSHLDVISVWSYPPFSLEERLVVSFEQLQAEASENANAVIAAVLEYQPGLADQADSSVGESETEDEVRVDLKVVQGVPSHLLVEASRDADLLVVGRNDDAKLRHLVLGSVASQCVRHAACPTMVVPPQENSRARTGRIVVGVDGSEDSLSALKWALAEAAVIGAEVRIVKAWMEPLTAIGELSDPMLMMTMLEESAVGAVDEWTATTEVPPGVTLTGLAKRGEPSAVLVEEAESADLVVVGSRGRGGFVGLLLGSVSRKTLHRASCPVVVIPRSADTSSLDSEVTA